MLFLKIGTFVGAFMLEGNKPSFFHHKDELLCFLLGAPDLPKLAKSNPLLAAVGELSESLPLNDDLEETTSPFIIAAFERTMTARVDTSIPGMFFHSVDHGFGVPSTVHSSVHEINNGKTQIVTYEISRAGGLDIDNIDFIIGDVPEDKREAVKNFMCIHNGSSVDDNKPYFRMWKVVLPLLTLVFGYSRRINYCEEWTDRFTPQSFQRFSGTLTTYPEIPETGFIDG